MTFVAKDLTREFREASLGDKWGPELVVGIFDEDGTFYGSFVGDNTSLCPPNNRVWNGGIRDVTNHQWINASPLQHCAFNFQNLARPMTLKHFWCYPRNEIPSFGLWGGGKGTAVRQGFGGSRNEFFAEWTRALSNFELPDGRKLLGQAFIGGADAGLNEDDLALICKVNGSNSCVTGGPGYYQYEKSGITGRVMVRAAQVLAKELGLVWDDELAVGIWGFGNVGKGVAMGLRDPQLRGPRIILASNRQKEKEGAVFSYGGIPPERLLEAAQDPEEGISSLTKLKSKRFLKYPLGQELYDDLLDILFLALPKENLINRENAFLVKPLVYLCGTNSGISEDGYLILHERGKIAPPDFVVNMGAASTAKSSWHGLTDEACETLVFRAIERNLLWILEESRRQKRSMRAIALDETRNALAALKH